MVNYSEAAALDATFAALSDCTRRAILARLASGECSISELAEPFDMSLPAVSKHVRVLEDAGLLVREIDGRVHRCNIGPQPISAAASWLDEMRQFWESRLDALAEFIDTMEEESTWPKSKRKPAKSSKSAGRSTPHPKNSSGRGRTPN